ncbi:MAG TPA: PQQ-dependent sugar dehydrogenase, partial [Bacteroidia bacterium]|nr:PQQ-dependent sugar dehydrogenase [Bacteroidia bacterium]
HQTSTGNYAQMLNKPFGKTLRIGKDPVPVGSNVHAVGGMSCNVPTDNPFYDDGNPLTGNCDIIWSYGHRNPFDFTFSTTTDTMYVAENGLNTWDEIDVIHRGANYGWNTCEGRYMNSSTSSLCNLAGSVLPLEEYAAPVPSLTGILFYTSSVMPEFTNHLLVADNNYARIYNLTLGNAPAYDTMLSRVQWQDMAGGFTTLKQGSDGCVYAMTGGYNANGNIKRICPQGLDVENHDNPYFSIQPNVPNPFSTTSTLSYSMKQNAAVHIGLYDLGGKEVAVLVDGAQQEGEHTFEINAQKLGLAPGLYFCLMNSGNYTESIKISVIK